MPSMTPGPEGVDLLEGTADHVVVCALVAESQHCLDRLVEIAGRDAHRVTGGQTRLWQDEVDRCHGLDPAAGEAVVEQRSLLADEVGAERALHGFAPGGAEHVPDREVAERAVQIEGGRLVEVHRVGRRGQRGARREVAAEIVARQVVDRAGHDDGQPTEPGDLEFVCPVAVEILGEEADEVVLAVAERRVAAVGEVVGGELVRHQRQRIVEQLSASLGSFVEADLEGADAVEAGPVPTCDELVDPDRIADLGHRDEPGSDVAVTEPEGCRLAACGSPGPGAGEAVGLLLGGDRRQRTVERTEAQLDRVCVLVREHGADRGGAVLVGQLGQQPVVAVVVDHEVADAAVEGDVLLHVVVCGARGAAARDVVGASWVRRVDVTLQWGELLAVDRRIDLGPPEFEVGHHREQERVVGALEACCDRS